MMLYDLAQQLLPCITPSVQKDIRTALNVLAKALGYVNASVCPLQACMHPLGDLQARAEAWLRETDAKHTALGKAPKTSFKVRNVRTNLARVYRLAEAQGLFATTSAELTARGLLSRRSVRANGAYRAIVHHDGHYLGRRHWPAALEAEVAAFEYWATAPVVAGRDARWRKRPETLANDYQKAFEGYFGYLHHHLSIHHVTFEHLFDFPLIEHYVSWHINEKFHRTTNKIQKFIEKLLAMTRQYRPNPILEAQLVGLKRRIGRPAPVYNKDEAWVPLLEIDRVGRALWPKVSLAELAAGHGRRPYQIGRQTASRAGISLIFRLWVWLPLRQRNMREMELDRNLYKIDGTWRIRFTGDELKISRAKGRVKTLHAPFPSTLVPQLEEYLDVWRPLLSPASPVVFPTMRGTPYTKDNMRDKVMRLVYAYTGKHLHPHMIRTIWATEWIISGGDFVTAAVMLGHTPEITIKNYAHLLDEHAVDRAFQWVESKIKSI